MTNQNPFQMNIQLQDTLCLSKPGKRVYNEDCVYPDEPISVREGENNVFLVCDGVGGSDRGEVASRLVCKEMYEELKGRLYISDDEITTAISKAQMRIDQYIADHHIEQRMATTMTFLGFDQEGAVFAHVGDSRIYHIRNNQILYCTKDHSLVNELVMQNLISQEDARNHPQKNVITKAISGFETDLRPDFYRTSNILPGDYFFMCTDGVIESLDDDGLLYIIAEKATSNHQKVGLIDIACSATSKDNYSFYLIQVGAVI